ncbi:hypothetical protein AAMO2058_001293200 [Amorphochlora amoebiformis]
MAFWMRIGGARMVKPFRHGKRALSRNVDPNEIRKFGKLAEQWWDPNGPQGMLRLMNPARIRYVRHRLQMQFGTLSEAKERPLSGLKVLDIGCGGGFASESLAGIGADVLGLDASEEAIGAATKHAESTGLIGEDSSVSLRYEVGTVESLSESRGSFDVITALDIIEHVPDQTHFLCSCLSLLKPGGAMFVCTLNRTLLSYALAIGAAEYVMGLVPRGTHEWNKFVTPDEISAMVAHYEDFEVLNQLGKSEADSAVVIEDVCGIKYDPFRVRWGLDPSDHQVNYIVHISKI